MTPTDSWVCAHRWISYSHEHRQILPLASTASPALSPAQASTEKRNIKNFKMRPQIYSFSCWKRRKESIKIKVITNVISKLDIRIWGYFLLSGLSKFWSEFRNLFHRLNYAWKMVSIPRSRLKNVESEQKEIKMASDMLKGIDLSQSNIGNGTGTDYPFALLHEIPTRSGWRLCSRQLNLTPYLKKSQNIYWYISRCLQC